MITVSIGILFHIHNCTYGKVHVLLLTSRKSSSNAGHSMITHHHQDSMFRYNDILKYRL